MEIMSSPLPALPVDVGDALMQRELALKLAAMTLASQPGRPQPASTTGTDTVARTLLSTLTALARGQDSLGQLLSDLVQSEPLARLPAEIRADIQRVLVLARPLVEAGLTRPDAAQAQGQPPASANVPTPQPADPRLANLAPLATALERLQSSLKTWQPVATQPPANQVQTPAAAISQPATATPLPQAAPPPETAPLAAPQRTPAVQAQAQPGSAPASTQATTPPGSGSVPPQAAPTDPLRASPIAGADDDAQFATANLLLAAANPAAMQNPTPAAARTGGIADALVSLLLAQQAGATPEESVQRLRSQRQALPAGAEADPHSMPASNAVAAYRKAMPTAPVSTATQWPADPSEALIARTLLQRTEAALTQTRLLDVATQLQRAEHTPAPPSNTTPGHWNFELPLATPLGQTLVRFELERQARKAAGKPETVWRARLSLDVEPLGPIHAQIALLGTKTWVSLWAERPDTAHLLAEGQSVLRQSLGGEDLEAEIVFHGGAPASGPGGTGGMWDANA